MDTGAERGDVQQCSTTAGAEHPQQKFVPAADAAISSIPSDVRGASTAADAAAHAPRNERGSSSSAAAGCTAAEADSTPETATAAAVRSLVTHSSNNVVDARNARVCIRNFFFVNITSSMIYRYRRVHSCFTQKVGGAAMRARTSHRSASRLLSPGVLNPPSVPITLVTARF